MGHPADGGEGGQPSEQPATDGQDVAPPIVDGETSRPVVQAEETRRPPRDAKRSAPKWESAARERVRATIRRFSKPLLDLVERDANEGDTRLLVTDFLCDGLGFDKYEDLTTEYQVKGEFADYGIRIEKQLIAFIEVKRCTQKLGARHLRQVQMYAVNEGVEWMILTNGQVWQVWHLTGGLPVVVDLALEVDLLGEGTIAQKVDSLFHLSKDAIRRRLLDELWKAKAATAPKSLATIVLSDSVIEAVRKELRRQTAYNVDLTELRRVLSDEVIRSELL
ncbi:MAG: type I restriction enzyme HsdR N-terminal domain-containing protein [Acidobacteria bacterium]|nr:type I restriction enzyme HsdR N-terminal domain-containing protein [Acidobacteriota bacterium]